MMRSITLKEHVLNTLTVIFVILYDNKEEH